MDSIWFLKTTNPRQFTCLRAVVLGLALVAVTIAACGDDTGAEPDAEFVSPACMEATMHSDLAWIEENVFATGCSVADVCHRGGNPAGGLDLEPGNAEANLVDVTSELFPTETLVVPGDPQASYLMVILGSYPGQLPTAGTMPPNNPLVCAQKREAIERWITSLAQ